MESTCHYDSNHSRSKFDKLGVEASDHIDSPVNSLVSSGTRAE